MAKGMSATQRTLAALKKMGRTCGVVEKFVRFGKDDPRNKPGKGDGVGFRGFRKDLFGFIDIICLDPAEGIVAIQSCGTSFSDHKKKICEEKHAEVREWIQCGGKVELWGWRKLVVKRGGKAMKWTPRIEKITLDMLCPF